MPKAVLQLCGYAMTATQLVSTIALKSTHKVAVMAYGVSKMVGKEELIKCLRDKYIPNMDELLEVIGKIKHRIKVSFFFLSDFQINLLLITLIFNKYLPYKKLMC